MESRYPGNATGRHFPLEFIDHRTLLALDQYAARRLATVVLQSTPSIVQRLAKLIPLHALRLEETP